MAQELEHSEPAQHEDIPGHRGRNRTIEGDFPYVYLDGVILKHSWACEVRNISGLVAIGVGTDGYLAGVNYERENDCEQYSTRADTEETMSNEQRHPNTTLLFKGEMAMCRT